MLASSRSSSAARLSRSAATALKWSRTGSPAFNPLCTLAASFHPRVAANGYGFSSTKAPKPFFESCLSHIAHRSALARSYSASAAATGQISNSEFTEMAWDGVVSAVDAVRESKQQVVETEHMMKALLEQKDGLARRIFTKAVVDNTSLLQSIDSFISQQPKVMGDTSGPIMGSHLSAMLDIARKFKKEMGDSFLSVEHLVLAFPLDKRFGVQLFKNLQLSENALKYAVQSVRGSQRVTDQSIIFFVMYI